MRRSTFVLLITLPFVGFVIAALAAQHYAAPFLVKGALLMGVLVYGYFYSRWIRNLFS